MNVIGLFPIFFIKVLILVIVKLLIWELQLTTAIACVVAYCYHYFLIIVSFPSHAVIVPAQLLLSAKRKKQSHYRSVISDIFDGSILSLVQCLTCDRVRQASTTAESMTVMYLPHNTRGSNIIIFCSGMWPQL